MESDREVGNTMSFLDGIINVSRSTGKMKAFVQALICLCLISVTEAIQCNSTDAFGPYASFSNQNDVDTKLAGCTSIDGDLYIKQGYTGSFVMNNITSVSGYLQADFGGPGNLEGPTSIEVNDLIYLGGLYISGIPPLKNVSFPDLNTTSDLEIHFNATGAEAHFPSLSNATNLLLYGPMHKMDFPSLTTANRLTVSSNDSFNDPSSLNFYEYVEYPYPPLDISFASIQNCTALFLYGNLSGLSMPQLANCPGQTAYSGGVMIAAIGNQLNVTLPNLWNTTQITLSGTIGSFSFPSLLTLDGLFNLYSYYSLGFNFAPLKSVSVLYLNSNLTSLNLSTIQEVDQVTIYSSVHLDCTPAAEAWARAKTVPLVTDHDQQLHNDAWSKFSCNYYHPDKPGLSKGAKIGIGLGVGLPIFIVLVYFLNRQGRKNAARREAKLEPPPPYEHELNDWHARDLTGHEDLAALPTYVPRSERAVSVSDVSSLSDDDGERAIHEQVPPSPVGEPGDGIHRGLGIRTGHEGHT